MSEESLLLVRSMKERIGRLFGEFEKVEQKNAVLREEIALLSNRIVLLEKQLEELTSKYENLKLAKGFESGFGDNRVVRQKINKLVREIDKCVALLNE
jgi:predicted  nucleic acid-binding Zn-ribbon protein